MSETGDELEQEEKEDLDLGPDFDIAEASRQRERVNWEAKQEAYRLRTEAVAELAAKQECWCGSDVVNPHSENCQNLQRAVGKYKEAKLNVSRVDDVDAAQAEAQAEQEKIEEDEKTLTPGAQMAQEVDDWASILNEARAKDWNMSDGEKEGTDPENDAEPSAEALEKLNEMLGVKPKPGV